ncbi:TadE/TadG family type IV pilus assembly protein [Kribbella sp. NPDC026611]|uniref:TadE/TadG family type IV pilus assembly protein n=1 Tax=Kribbella sp. NPDC026611 TaxID=3154911 RepID=UPI0033EF654D
MQAPDFLGFFRIDAPSNKRRTLRRRPLGRGALSPAVAILAVMIFMLAGLVIDGGRQLGARSRAVGYAQEAARVGAAAIQLNSSEAKIDTVKAATAITAFCGQVKANDPAVSACTPTTLTEKEVDIQVDIANKTTFLGLIGRNSLKAVGTGQAHPEQGINKADDSPTIPGIVVLTSPDGPGGTIGEPHPPTIDLPCPDWTIGSPTPTWTWSPIPFPPTCKPTATPTDTPPSSTPPTSSPTPTKTKTHR